MRLLHNVNKLYEGCHYTEDKLDKHDNRLDTIDAALTEQEKNVNAALEEQANAIKAALVEQLKANKAALAEQEERYTAALSAIALRHQEQIDEVTANAAKFIKDFEEAVRRTISVQDAKLDRQAEQLGSMPEIVKEFVKLETRLDAVTKSVAHWYDSIEMVKSKTSAAVDGINGAVSTQDTRTAHIDARLVNLEAQMAALTLRLQVETQIDKAPGAPKAMTPSTTPVGPASTDIVMSTEPESPVSTEVVMSSQPQSDEVPVVTAPDTIASENAAPEDGQGLSGNTHVAQTEAGGEPPCPPSVNMTPPTPLCSQEAAEYGVHVLVPIQPASDPASTSTPPSATSPAPPSVPPPTLPPPPTDSSAPPSTGLDTPEPTTTAPDRAAEEPEVQSSEAPKARRSARPSSRPNSSASLEPPVPRNTRSRSPQQPPPAKR